MRIYCSQELFAKSEHNFILFEDLAHRLCVSPWLLRKATVPLCLVPAVHFMGVLLAWIKMEEQSSLSVCCFGFFPSIES